MNRDQALPGLVAAATDPLRDMESAPLKCTAAEPNAETQRHDFTNLRNHIDSRRSGIDTTSGSIQFNTLRR